MFGRRKVAQQVFGMGTRNVVNATSRVMPSTARTAASVVSGSLGAAPGRLGLPMSRRASAQARLAAAARGSTSSRVHHMGSGLAYASPIGPRRPSRAMPSQLRRAANVARYGGGGRMSSAMFGRPNSTRRSFTIGAGTTMAAGLGANAVLGPKPPSSGRNGLR